MIRRLLRFALPSVAVVGLAAGALTGCQIYPSGCVRIPSGEVPFPSSWDGSSVWWHHDGTVTFVGVSGGSPWYDFTDTWHGPSRFTGWAEYASARNCYETGGAYAG